MRGIIAGDNGLIRHAKTLTCCRCHDRLRSCCAKTGAGGGRDRRRRRRLPIILPARQTMAQTTTIDDLLRIFRTPKRDDRQSCDRLFGSFVLCPLFFPSFIPIDIPVFFLRGIAPLTSAVRLPLLQIGLLGPPTCWQPHGRVLSGKSSAGACPTHDAWLCACSMFRPEHESSIWRPLEWPKFDRSHAKGKGTWPLPSPPPLASRRNE